jgi:hypothetical protein
MGFWGRCTTRWWCWSSKSFQTTREQRELRAKSQRVTTCNTSRPLVRAFHRPLSLWPFSLSPTLLIRAYMLFCSLLRPIMDIYPRHSKLRFITKLMGPSTPKLEDHPIKGLPYASVLKGYRQCLPRSLAFLIARFDISLR